MGHEVVEGADQPHPFRDGRGLRVVSTGRKEVRVIVGQQGKVYQELTKTCQG